MSHYRVKTNEQLELTVYTTNNSIQYVDVRLEK